jgi:hypothetical protein
VQLEDLIEQCSIESAVGLFRAYRVTLECADATERAVMPAASLCGVVGFVGRQLSGAMLLAVTPEPLASSNPTTTSSRDWIAELANQLFGRIRNRLLQRGLDLAGTPPVVVRGDGIEALTANTDCRPIVLRGPAGGKVCVWVDCVPKDGLPVSLAETDAERDVVPEGSVMFF